MIEDQQALVLLEGLLQGPGRLGGEVDAVLRVGEPGIEDEAVAAGALQRGIHQILEVVKAVGGRLQGDVPRGRDRLDDAPGQLHPVTVEGGLGQVEVVDGHAPKVQALGRVDHEGGGRHGNRVRAAVGAQELKLQVEGGGAAQPDGNLDLFREGVVEGPVDFQHLLGDLVQVGEHQGVPPRPEEGVEKVEAGEVGREAQLAGLQDDVPHPGEEIHPRGEPVPLPEPGQMVHLDRVVDEGGQTALGLLGPDPERGGREEVGLGADDPHPLVLVGGEHPQLFRRLALQPGHRGAVARQDFRHERGLMGREDDRLARPRGQQQPAHWAAGAWAPLLQGPPQRSMDSSISGTEPVKRRARSST